MRRRVPAEGSVARGTIELGDGLEHLAQHRARPVTIDTTNAKLRQGQSVIDGVLLFLK
jgi:hypothetical protein